MDYNTLEGIAGYLDSLEGLNRLIDDRSKAGYVRREVLSNFIVLGSWSADACGNFMRITRPTDLRGRVPRVITREALFQEFKGLTLESTMGHNVPPAHVGCSECGQKWTIDNCYGIIVKDASETISLRPFVGQTLAEVGKVFEARTDAQYRLGIDLIIRNDNRVDLRQDPKYESLKINERGWARRSDGIDDNYIVQEGDEGYFTVWRHFHPACNAIYMERTFVEHYREILNGAGVEGEIKAIPNGYCPCEHCGPWVEITTKWGPIIMGWRKRVIDIDWSGTGWSADKEFESETVTKDSTSIHAWGKAKAIDYLKRLQTALNTKTGVSTT